jgi:tetratricopeptide (TPR) repeat protein
MSILKIFSARTPEAHEQKGDELLAAGLWGKAKVEYERALEKLENASPRNDEIRNRLEKKCDHVKEALAQSHKLNADDMLEAGFHDDARELYILASELTQDPALRTAIEEGLKQLDFQVDKAVAEQFREHDIQAEEIQEPEFTEKDVQGKEYFRALCGTLPGDVQKAYLTYGDNFTKGYLALNLGEFVRAVDYLGRALEENPSADSYIPLELATAYLNLGNLSEAQHLLEAFLKATPEALPAYQLLCEIFWEQKAFDRAQALLASVPEELTESVAVYLLKGETLYQSGNHIGAKEFYQNFLKTYGWNETIAGALARTHENLNEIANARNLYREIMDGCRSCHTRIDPFIKQRYADLCFDSGMLNTDILELYLSLAQEVPDNAADYYEKVSHIYAAQGNDAEARRFRAIAEKLGTK